MTFGKIGKCNTLPSHCIKRTDGACKALIAVSLPAISGLKKLDHTVRRHYPREHTHRVVCIVRFLPQARHNTLWNMTLRTNISLVCIQYVRRNTRQASSYGCLKGLRGAVYTSDIRYGLNKGFALRFDRLTSGSRIRTESGCQMKR
jgi:hypothetical protein